MKKSMIAAVLIAGCAALAAAQGRHQAGWPGWPGRGAAPEVVVIEALGLSDEQVESLRGLLQTRRRRSSSCSRRSRKPSAPSPRPSTPPSPTRPPSGRWCSVSRVAGAGPRGGGRLRRGVPGPAHRRGSGPASSRSGPPRARSAPPEPPPARPVAGQPSPESEPAAVAAGSVVRARPLPGGRGRQLSAVSYQLSAVSSPPAGDRRRSPSRWATSPAEVEARPARRR